MASSNPFFLLAAAMAVVTAAASAEVVGEQPDPSAPSCNPSVKEKLLARCHGVKPLVGKLNQHCCRELADRMSDQCFCQDKERISRFLGVGLHVVCNRATASCSSSGAAPPKDDGCTPAGEQDVMAACRDAVPALQRQDQDGCFCLLANVRQRKELSGKPKVCLAAALTELGINNADVLDKLCQPSDSRASPLLVAIDY